MGDIVKRVHQFNLYGEKRNSEGNKGEDKKRKKKRRREGTEKMRLKKWVKK